VFHTERFKNSDSPIARNLRRKIANGQLAPSKTSAAARLPAIRSSCRRTMLLATVGVVHITKWPKIGGFLYGGGEVDCILCSMDWRMGQGTILIPCVTFAITITFTANFTPPQPNHVRYPAKYVQKEENTTKRARILQVRQ